MCLSVRVLASVEYRHYDCLRNDIVIYKALCFDVTQGRMNRATNETRTHSYRFASLAC